ncbi:MAG: zinc ABC transporter substrate-binding protein [Janthinobacterium lividum]
MIPISKWFAITTLWLFVISPVYAYKIVVSIPPLASLARAIAGEQAEIDTIVDQAVSPHVYALKPSDLRKMNQADVVFWIGPAYENFLEKALKNCLAKVVGLLNLSSLKIHGLRHAEDGHLISCPHGCAHDLDPLKRDGHIWLDPDNGIIMAQEIAHQLSIIDPLSKEIYAARFKKFKQNIEKLKSNLQDLLTPYQSQGFLVFHDGYQYFEKVFGLKEGHVMSLIPDVSPSIKHMKDLRKLIKDKNVVILFAETQFSPRLMQVLADETHLKIGLLDPLGFSDHTYEELLTNLATSFSNGFKSLDQGTSS